MKNIVLFASGNGTNAENICRHFNGHPHIRVAALFCNNPSAGVIDRVKGFGVPVHLFNKAAFNDEHAFLPVLSQYRPDLIVLAGFLWLVPSYIVRAFPSRIINIHPALLPRHGGKGMYGHHVHDAVISAGDSQHGITIHYVNERFDEGDHVFQAQFDVRPGDTADTVAGRIATLEMEHFPKVIEKLLSAENSKR